MSNCRPLRASPLLRPGSTRPSRDPNPLEDLRASSVSVPELVGLTPQEIEFIDAVIERAPATATTFLTVLKVYNDLLQERGLDPQNEVVYFGKLLKLGTVKGKNWKEKWQIVKNHHGYRANPSPTRPGPPTFVPRSRKPDPEIDTFTLDSNLDETEGAPSIHADFEVDDPQYHDTPRPTYRRSQSPTRSVATTSNSLGLDLGMPASLPLPIPRFSHQPRRPFGGHKWDAQSSESTDAAPTQISTPPSYGAAVRDPAPDPVVAPFANFRTRYTTKKIEPDTKQIVKPPPEPIKARRESVINVDEAWNKVKMLRDEEDADKFREEKLVERCWDVWRQGLEWITTTNEQISEARDTLVLRVSLQKWRARTASRREFHDRVQAISDSRCLKAALSIWKAKLQVKRQAQWRDAMRYKMKIVRSSRENKLKKDAWAKWRQSYQSHLSGQHYTERLVLRSFQQWKRKLGDLDRQDAAADEYARMREDRAQARCWGLWKRVSELKSAERVMAERVDLRIMSGVIEAWKRHMRERERADAFYDMLVKQRTIRAWREAQAKIRAKERRAAKHLARKDEVLVHAIMRVWKSRERGKLLERVKTVRIVKDAWAMWKRRMREQRDRENLALAFSVRPNTTVAVASLRIWRRVYQTHKNAAAFAVHYHSAQLGYKIMLAWRLRLRDKTKKEKQARIAEKFLLLRRSWKSWKTKLEDAKREKKAVLWEKAKLKVSFERWCRLAQRQQQLRSAEQTMKERVSLRIVSNVLRDWTNSVANMKFRELETVQEYEYRLVARLFKKWKAVCIRHVEELSLMQSYQDIKREENMRKMFYKWLNAARTARRRRVTLQEKEEEMKQTHLAIAWDKWRERSQDIRLQPVAEEFMVQRQRHLVFYAFGLWHSKTRSLPALRFHASHTKEKFWNVWRNAMPRALQSKEARDMERNSVLSKAFEKWLKNYRTKIALKAIARARYLRLPTTAPRQNGQQSRVNPTPASPTSRTPAFPRRTIRATSPERDDISDAGSSRTPFPRPPASRSGIASLLITKSTSPDNPPSRPKFSSRASTREPSPARSRSSFGGGLRDRSPPKLSSRAPSTVGGEGGKSRLWMELREVQRRSRPPTERSPSPS